MKSILNPKDNESMASNCMAMSFVEIKQLDLYVTHVFWEQTFFYIGKGLKNISGINQTQNKKSNGCKHLFFTGIM